MKLAQQEVDNIVNYVRNEPRTVQDLAKFMSKSWVTAEKYIQEIERENGSIAMKVFRKGSQGALKVVYYVSKNSSMSSEVMENLTLKIKAGQKKTDFKFLDIYSHIPEESKKSQVNNYASYEELCSQVEDSITIFSGNLSFINIKENGKTVLDIFEELLKRKVVVKILCRVNIGSIKNLDKISGLLIKYPGMIEIKHCYQPLRGIIIDDKFSRFSDDELMEDYKEGEIDSSFKIFFEVYDSEWNSWLKKVFWNLFRTSVDYSVMYKELKKII